MPALTGPEHLRTIFSQFCRVSPYTEREYKGCRFLNTRGNLGLTALKTLGNLPNRSTVVGHCRNDGFLPELRYCAQRVGFLSSHYAALCQVSDTEQLLTSGEVSRAGSVSVIELSQAVYG